MIRQGDYGQWAVIEGIVLEKMRYSTIVVSMSKECVYSMILSVRYDSFCWGTYRTIGSSSLHQRSQHDWHLMVITTTTMSNWLIQQSRLPSVGEYGLPSPPQKACNTHPEQEFVGRWLAYAYFSIYPQRYRPHAHFSTESGHSCPCTGGEC